VTNEEQLIKDVMEHAKLETHIWCACATFTRENTSKHSRELGASWTRESAARLRQVTVKRLCRQHAMLRTRWLSSDTSRYIPGDCQAHP